MMKGGWNFSVAEECTLPKEVADGFEEIFSKMLGAKFVPVLYSGIQVVEGINHMIICKTKLACAGAVEKLIKVVINETIVDEKSNWSVVSIGDIV